MERYEVVLSPRFSRATKGLQKKNLAAFTALKKQIIKISDNPDLGKPLRNVLKNKRRVHIGSFVLIYEIYNKQIFLLDFDHHDKIYKEH